MGPQARQYFLNTVLGFVPDLVVCWAAAHFTNSGWPGFFISLVALQAIYLFFWFKNALWAWLLFWVYRKRKMAAYMENYFIDSRFPVPDEYTTDLDDYLGGITNNEELDATTRVKAAFELGTFNGLKTANRISLLLQLNFAARIALKRYAHRGEKSSPPRALDNDEHRNDQRRNDEPKDHNDKEAQMVQRIQFLCQVTKSSAEVVKEQDRNDPQFDYEHKLYLRRKLQAVDLARSIRDEFYLSAALHQIIELCLAAGEIADAKQLLSDVKVDFILEQILKEHVELLRP